MAGPVHEIVVVADIAYTLSVHLDSIITFDLVEYNIITGHTYTIGIPSPLKYQIIIASISLDNKSFSMNVVIQGGRYIPDNLPIPPYT